MKKIVFLISILLVFSLAGCYSASGTAPTEKLEPDFSPLFFNSIADLKSEKDARNAPSYQGDDPQNLKDLKACYQFSDISDDIKLSRYSMRESYIAVSYIYQNSDDAYMSKFSGLGLSKDELQTITLTAHRDMGQSELNEFVSRNSKSVETVALGNIAQVYCFKAMYSGSLMATDYYFMFMDQYFCLEVPGNLPNERASDLIKSIIKISLS